VTRLDEVSPIGKLFTFGSLKKIHKNHKFLTHFFPPKISVLILTIFDWARFWAIFVTSWSGHPEGSRRWSPTSPSSPSSSSSPSRRNWFYETSFRKKSLRTNFYRNFLEKIVIQKPKAKCRYVTVSG
jgi:hypothetical protein